MTEFSIIVPVYNVENYLKRCLDSIKAQTYADYEAILIDDGSLDASGSICDAYVEQDNRFKVIHKENGGLAAARNTGLGAAVGKYIVFLDSDDDLEKEALTKIRETMNNGCYDIGSFAARRIDAKRHFLYELRFDDMVGERVFDSKSRERFLWQDFLQYKAGWEVCFHVFRRDIIETHHIRFDEQVKYAEDIPFTFRYMLYVCRWVKMPDILYNYTLRDSSLSRQVRTQDVLEGILYVDYNLMCRGLNGEQQILLYGALLYYFRDFLLKGNGKENGIEGLREALRESEHAKFHRERLRRLRWRGRSLQKLYGQEQGREFYRMICRLQKGMGMRV